MSETHKKQPSSKSMAPPPAETRISRPAESALSGMEKRPGERRNTPILSGDEDSVPFQAGKNLSRVEDYFQVAFENSNDGIAIVKEGTFLFINKRFGLIFGYDQAEDLVGRRISMVIHPEDQSRVLGISQKRQEGLEVPSRYEYKGMRKDGREVSIEVSVAVTGYRGKKVHLSFHRDISERKRLEALLHQAQKMEAIGTLAGGIAHDFNNLLAVILGGIELSILEVPKDSLIHTYLLEVLGATERATDLVQQILTFSRKKELERKPLQLAILCKEALKMLRASIPSTIEIQQDIDPRSGLALADPTQIHQIIMNLCSNAAQAMGEKGGVLQVTLKNTDFKGQEVFSDTVTEAGPYLELTVSDTGEGIAPAILERIFDPYFTTKKIDKGTGLGLAVVQGIIKAYQGAIRVSSNPGQGTTFQIYLPRIEDPEIVERFAQVRQLPRGTERILLVDDEESFVRLAKNILERLGYHVVATTNSLEALEVFKKGPENFDLVLTDHIMPKLTGTELARRIHWINPAIPIMIITGMGDLIPTEQKESTPVKKFIMKPLFIHSLAEKIREVLDQ